MEMTSQPTRARSAYTRSPFMICNVPHLRAELLQEIMRVALALLALYFVYTKAGMLFICCALVLWLLWYASSAGAESLSAVSVILGRNISFNCSSNHAKVWKIAQSGVELFNIYLSVLAAAAARGFSIDYPTHLIERLTVLGSVQNNQIEIYCRRVGTTQVIASFALTVIGS